MIEVFVVIGEHGEYSDRCVFVSGVFATESEARSAAEKALAARRAYDQWQETLARELRNVPYDWIQPYGVNPAGYSDETLKKASEKLPPRPPYESAERCEVIKATVGVWGGVIDCPPDI